MTDRVVSSAMKYRTQVAFVDGLMMSLACRWRASAVPEHVLPQLSTTEKSAGATRRVGKSTKDDE